VFGEAYGKHRYRSDVEHAAGDFGRRRRACRRGAERPRGSTDFAQVLQTSIARVSQVQEQAGAMAANFAAGNGTENLHEVMIELQKANISFQEMVQVRNRLVSAYNDVMNMQV
jgi:flagellar hook-basal body complex protein FliE